MVNIYFYIVEYFKYSPKIIQFLWALSAVFVLIIISLSIYLNHLRVRLRAKERIKAVYQKKYESDLIEYLYSGNEVDEISYEQQIIIDYLNKCAKSSLKRKIIISTLLKLKDEISGETSDAIQRLYCQTGLVHYASSKLKSKKWDVIAKGINELAQFEIKEAHNDVIEHIDHPKREVRKEIQMYSVKLFRFDGLEFLNILTTQLSEWDQIQLLEILQKFESQNMPDITKWLQSSNDSVVSFALKLAKIYNQYEAKEHIVALLNHSSQEIRIESITVLSNFGDIDTSVVLKNDFNQRSIEEQVAIFKMIEDLNDTSDIPFLLEHVNNSNFEIKVLATKILKELNNREDNNIRLITTDIEYSEKTGLIKAS